MAIRIINFQRDSGPSGQREPNVRARIEWVGKILIHGEVRGSSNFTTLHLGSRWRFEDGVHRGNGDSQAREQLVTMTALELLILISQAEAIERVCKRIVPGHDKKPILQSAIEE